MTRASPVLAVLLAAGAAAQPPATWGAVERTARYEYRLMNPSALPARDITVHVPLPPTTVRQQIHYLRLSRPGYRRTFTDRHGQRFACYHIAELPAGAHRDFGFAAGVTLRSQRWRLEPDAVVADLDAATRALHLAPRDKYSMASTAMRDAAARLSAAGDDDLTRLSRIHDFVCDRVRYVRDNRWDPAAEVLRRGTGSCSEYNYVLSGLCRLAGLPTRQVGGSACRRADLPYTDTVFHRWTEVFLGGIGWFPADCARNADPVRGRRGGFGRIYADVLVWTRGPGGGDRLGWDYRAQRTVHGSDPGLSCSHRARWFASLPSEDLDRAARWLEKGVGQVPGADALECALLHYGAMPHEAQVRAVATLARAGRAAALRRAATLRLPPTAHLDLLCSLTTSEDLARRLQDRGGDPWQLHTLWRSLEGRLQGAGNGRLALRPATAVVRIVRGNAADDRIQDVLLAKALAGLRRQLDGWRGGHGELAVICAQQTAAPESPLSGSARLALGGIPGVRLIDGSAFDALLEDRGAAPREYWAWAMRDRRRAEPAVPTALAAEAVVVPILRRDHSGGRTVVTLELRALHLERREVFSTAVSYAVVP